MQYCHATLNYAGSVDYDPVEVSIKNGRTNRPNFDTAGFDLIKHESKVSNWHDYDEVDAVHQPEVEQLCLDLTGCDHAIVYPSLIRSPQTAKSSADYAPIESVHSDYTEDYRRMVTNPDHAYQGFLQPLLEKNGLTCDDLASAARLMVMQFWRNIGDVNPDRPLALCDASTVSRDELISILVPEYGGQKLDFEACVVRTPINPESHAWYTFPSMQKNETLAFRTYDSLCEDEGRAFYTPHTAFSDPNVGLNAPKRESVEMRALCVFR